MTKAADATVTAEESPEIENVNAGMAEALKEPAPKAAKKPADFDEFPPKYEVVTNVSGTPIEYRQVLPSVRSSA
jgi:hypothetical protein